jgi:hypothetical protein
MNNTSNTAMCDHICAAYEFKYTFFSLAYSNGIHIVTRGSCYPVLSECHACEETTELLWQHVADFILGLPVAERLGSITIGDTEIAIFADGDNLHIAERGSLGKFVIRLRPERVLDTLMQREILNTQFLLKNVTPT